MQCPGQDTRYWKPGSIFEAKCPECGGEVEFFKDEASRRCKKCGHRMLNPKMDFGCASYCKYAEQCLGDLPPELLAAREDLLKDRVALAVKRQFGRDFKRLGHATKVARYAEDIGKQEHGNLAIILPAAYLHDIGFIAAQKKFGQPTHEQVEAEGPALAREILVGLGARTEIIDAVCDIISHHHQPRSNDSLDFQVVYDADVLANLEEKHQDEPQDPDNLKRLIDSRLLTASGRALAAKVLLKA